MIVFAILLYVIISILFIVNDLLIVLLHRFVYFNLFYIMYIIQFIVISLLSSWLPGTKIKKSESSLIIHWQWGTILILAAFRMSLFSMSYFDFTLMIVSELLWLLFNDWQFISLRWVTLPKSRCYILLREHRTAVICYSYEMNKSWESGRADSWMMGERSFWCTAHVSVVKINNFRFFEFFPKLYF